MSKLPEHLRKKIEEKKDPTLHFQCEDNYCAAHKTFKAGAAAMHSLMLEEMKPIVEALENAEKELFRFNCDAPLDLTAVNQPVYLEAKQALSHYRERIGGVK